MNNEQLNTLAALAKAGCKDSHLAIVAYFLPKIYRASEYIWHSVSDQTKFEESCLKGVDDCIKRFEQGRGNLTAMVNWIISRYSLQYCGRYKKRRRGYKLESIHERRSEEKPNEAYEVSDDLAIVDDGFLVNERIALLAESDPRKLAILNAWTNGEINDSETASFLAKRYGGNSESHRKFINRFRTHCRKTLATSSTA